VDRIAFDKITPDLIERWKKCDKEAERTLLWETNLFRALKAVIFKEDAKYYYNEVWPKNPESYLERDEIEGFATDALMGVRDRVKDNPSQYSFPDARRLWSYLKVSGIGACHNAVLDEVKIQQAHVAGDESTKDKEGIETEETIMSRIPSSDEAENGVLVGEIMDDVDTLYKNFLSSLSKQLRDHFLGLEKAMGDRVSLMNFLQAKGEWFPEVYDHFEKRGLKRRTFDTNNRRLREKWKNFSKRDGREPYNRLKKRYEKG